MKTKVIASFFPIVALPIQSDTVVSNGTVSYLIGGIVALCIMGYLIYSLLKPEKF
jgi:K+-transporting ATPase KdpF subunit